MKSEDKVGERKEKVQQEPLEKMSEGGKDSENKVQFIPLLPVSPRNALFEGFCIVFVFEDPTFLLHKRVVNKKWSSNTVSNELLSRLFSGITGALRLDII